jgi:hypothetical protein
VFKENESILIKDSRFHLACKKSLLKEDNRFEVVLIDVTESPVERTKKQRLNYSGKKKRHTQKAQIVADKTSGGT